MHAMHMNRRGEGEREREREREREKGGDHQTSITVSPGQLLLNTRRLVLPLLLHVSGPVLQPWKAGGYANCPSNLLATIPSFFRFCEVIVFDGDPEIIVVAPIKVHLTQDPCKGVACPMDVCSDGFPRRPIGDDCCACPDLKVSFCGIIACLFDLYFHSTTYSYIELYGYMWFCVNCTVYT